MLSQATGKQQYPHPKPPRQQVLKKKKKVTNKKLLLKVGVDGLTAFFSALANFFIQQLPSLTQQLAAVVLQAAADREKI